MDDFCPHGFLSDHADPYAIILGTNEIASAIAVRLSWERFRVVMSHDPFPPVIRRGMAFHDALYDDRAAVDGILGKRAESAVEIVEALATSGAVAVTPLQLTDLITLRTPAIVVDARMQKHRITPDLRGVAGLSIGIGPRFSVDLNCDIAVETHPARTGDLVAAGETLRADGVARALGGVGSERFVYSTAQGVWRTPLDIGAMVFRGYVIGYLDGLPVRAPMDGRLRGIARDGTLAPGGVKLAEIDPRGRQACWTGTDERGRAIAVAVVEAIEKAPKRRFAVTSQLMPH
ncbi:xanthine dehydrogenase [Methylocystis sp. IM3]|uniref:xanthine dehydrogenase n=1 Tax=unclassified Methylocystis TaxID=2625913 RepID=UPI0030FA1EBB